MYVRVTLFSLPTRFAGLPVIAWTAYKPMETIVTAKTAEHSKTESSRDLPIFKFMTFSPPSLLVRKMYELDQK
jgi:hypothetical protein